MTWSSLLIFVFFLFYSRSIPSLSSPSPLCHLDESIALLQFKNSFSIYNSFAHPDDCYYDNTKSWENGTNCCTWRGVTCDNLTGQVISVDAYCSGLEGILQSNNSLFSLSHLQTLILSKNYFHGSSISSEFGKFTHLTHLDLSGSGFSGHVPLEIAHLSNLVTLRLYSFSNKDHIEWDTLTLKRIVQNLTDLQELDLSNTDMSSVSPVSFMNLSSSLVSLNLDYTKLQGKFPKNIFQLPNLQELYLWGNYNLTGSFPKSNWSSPLKGLDLSFTGFSIDLDYLTKNLKNLNSLFLKNCKFIGSHPILDGNFTQFIALDISFNNFIGQVPWSSLNFKQITYLDLSSNHFVGELPIYYGNSNKKISLEDFTHSQSVVDAPLQLEFLSLANNNFNGTLPSWLYVIPSLRYLNIHGNQFIGVINEFQTRSLELLNLGNNQLKGMIPRSIFHQFNLTWLDLSSNNWTSVVEYDHFAKLKNLNHLDLSFNYLSLSFINSINSTFLMLSRLILASCNITQFPLFLKALKHLEHLDLSNNQIQGKVPTWLENMGTNSLSYLNLSHNFLTDIEQVPWKNLQFLDISSNKLQGLLPVPPPSIYVFLISNNQISGELPSLFCKIQQPLVLDLSANSLNGNIPPCIGNISVDVLDLQSNRFNGMIPSTFAKGNLLRNLNLKDNQLEGPLPQSLINCKRLEILDVSNNKINGSFPYWLQSLPVLQVLILRSNKFHGPISDPKARSPFQKLRILDISDNEFNGLLPARYFEKMMAMIQSHTNHTLKYMGEDQGTISYYYHDSVTVVLKGIFLEFVKIQTIFTTIDFSKNNFKGEIPKMIGQLKSLKGLNFSHNKLTGSIPPSLGNLTNLEWLDLSSNQLVGEIPKQLADLIYLEVLNLSQNHLVGVIPRGRQFNTFENDSYSGNIGLCGFPLSKDCNDDRAKQPSAVNFKEEEGDSVPEMLFDWKFALMGYGCGLVFGISMGYVLFSNQIIERLVGDFYVGGKLYKLGKSKKRHACINAQFGRRNH